MRFEYVDTDGNRDSELLYLKFKRDSVCTRPTKSHAFRVRLTHFGLLSRSHAHGTKSHAWR